MKIKVGIIFGGSSREREISFAGGRTVYDNLNKSIFEAIPLFVDSFGNFILLKWEYIYKGSIRDFYPPVDSLPSSKNEFQVYAESLEKLTLSEQNDLIKKIGKRIEVAEMKELIDFAFLCLHGSFGEDGRIQGLLEYMQIPYSGSGILSSATGMNKAVQKQLMLNAGFASPEYFTIQRSEWNITENRKKIFETVQSNVALSKHFVIKSANQGSSIGASILTNALFQDFVKAVNKSFFIYELSKAEWKKLSEEQQVDFIKKLTDIRERAGIPVAIKSTILYHPEELLTHIRNHFAKSNETLILQALDGESEVLVEQFIEGKEFSCIVIQNEETIPFSFGNRVGERRVVALPPTEIIKGKELFDYRSKYLVGLSRKITPINLPDKQIEEIRKECERLFKTLHFNVYARIDGFISKTGQLFLNDPNTTSGMMPSSFFFHQAAEIGLNPSQFLTYIIRTSIAERINDFKNYSALPQLLQQVDENIKQLQSATTKKIKIAVMLGGYSSERHVSVESGRNIYEKLSSSEKYEPLPIFLLGNEKEHFLYSIPINILLKDNADDIKEKINTASPPTPLQRRGEGWKRHKVVDKIIEQCKSIMLKYASSNNLAQPKKISYKELATMVDGVFIALHGRPGEDGVVQTHLEKVGLPYNGSGYDTSQITINKYETNEILRKQGFSVARHLLIYKKDWLKNQNTCIQNIFSTLGTSFADGLIAKPVDDGCSSAVKKIKDKKELIAFANLIFRDRDELNEKDAKTLNLKLKEEFPRKDVFLVEELITANGAEHFLEITGGMLTSFGKDGKKRYEVFEPSEALSEGDILSLEEKFLAGEGQNITPARYSKNPKEQKEISDKIRTELERAAKVLNIDGYARIDAFVRIKKSKVKSQKLKVDVVFIEVNSLPGMTPATCIFHQCAINGYKPYEFIDKILEYGVRKNKCNLRK